MTPAEKALRGLSFYLSERTEVLSAMEPSAEQRTRADELGKLLANLETQLKRASEE